MQVVTGACASDVDDGHFPSLEGRDNSGSPLNYLYSLPDDDDDLTPLQVLSPHNAAPGGSGDDDSVDRGITHALTSAAR